MWIYVRDYISVYRIRRLLLKNWITKQWLKLCQIHISFPPNRIQKLVPFQESGLIITLLSRIFFAIRHSYYCSLFVKT